MPSLARQFIVCLLAGAAISSAVSLAIAVAWRPTWSFYLREVGVTPPSDQPRWWAERQWYSGLTRWTTQWCEMAGDDTDYARTPNTSPDDLVPHWATFARERFITNKLRRHMFALVESGWPMRSFAGGMSRVSSATPYEDVITEHFAYQIGAPDEYFHRHRILPLRPLPLGFAVNTTVYGAVVWAALFLPGHLRRASRRRRGGCLGCGHPLGGSVTCPECGLAISA